MITSFIPMTTNYHIHVHVQYMNTVMIALGGIRTSRHTVLKAGALLTCIHMSLNVFCTENSRILICTSLTRLF